MSVVLSPQKNIPMAFFVPLTLLWSSAFINLSSPVREVTDLASDNAQELSIDNDPWRGIKVPGVVSTSYFCNIY